jgi:hypothetical protein
MTAMHTDRDREITRWIAGLGAAGAEHVALRFGVGRSQTYHRLHGLVAGGLLREHRLLHARPTLYAASAEGLRWTGLQRLGVQRVGAGAFEHAAEVARVAAELHRALDGVEILSERLIRALEAESGELLASVRLGELPGGRVALHRPDLALRLQSDVVAIEVELSAKAPRRLEAICRGWARARHLAHVYYLAPPNVARAVEGVIARVWAADRINVLPLDGVDALAAEDGHVVP